MGPVSLESAKLCMPDETSARWSSSFGAAALLVKLHLVLDAIIELKVVVLQGGGGA